MNSFEAVEEERHQENSTKLDELIVKLGKRTFWSTTVGVIISVAGSL